MANENEYLTILNYFGMKFRIVSEDQLYTDDVQRRTVKSDPGITTNGKDAVSRAGNYFVININGKIGIIYRSAIIGSGGPYGALMTTITLLKKAKDCRWPLEIIFAVGCAGGRADPGQVLNLGQVIVSKYVIDYNRGKVESSPEGLPRFKRDPEIWQTSISWLESLADSVIQHGKGNGHDISVAVKNVCSGDLVMKDQQMAEELRTIVGNPTMVCHADNVRDECDYVSIPHILSYSYIIHFLLNNIL